MHATAFKPLDMIHARFLLGSMVISDDKSVTRLLGLPHEA